MEAPRFIEEFNYFTAYCDFTDHLFLASLNLSDEVTRILYLLTYQADKDSRCFIPNPTIEMLIEETVSGQHTTTPYRCLLYTSPSPRDS